VRFWSDREEDPVDLVPLGEVALTYTSLVTIDYAVGGQLYGTMEGRISGERVNGRLALTNLSPRRPDNVNLPTLRGVLTTEDGAKVWIELDGVATLRPVDKARVFVTSVRFRAGDERYSWMDTILAVLEGVLDSVGVSGRARGRIFECRPVLV
jgi:hypothetical protein